MNVALLALTIAALGVAGCTSQTERLAAARRYDQYANQKFADADERMRLAQRVSTRFPEAIRWPREALEAQKKISHPQFLGSANFGFPEKPGAPLTKVWVVAIIEVNGAIAHVECHGEGDAVVAPEHVELITAAVRDWKFRPMLIDGQPSRCANIFPVLTDGQQFYVSSPKELE